MRPGLRSLTFLLTALVVLAIATEAMRHSRTQHAASVQERALRDAATCNLARSLTIATEATDQVAEFQRGAGSESDLSTKRVSVGGIDQLAHFAALNSLQAKVSRSFELRAEGEGSSHRVLEMSLNGDLNGFYAYLTRMEQLPDFERIVRLRLSRTSEHDGEVQAQIAIEMASGSVLKSDDNTHPLVTASMR